MQFTIHVEAFQTAAAGETRREPHGGGSIDRLTDKSKHVGLSIFEKRVEHDQELDVWKPLWVYTSAHDWPV